MIGGPEQTRNFAKKNSFNMKNFSSISLGNNDHLRELYERSKSNSSIRSCETPKDTVQMGKENLQQVLNNNYTTSNSLNNSVLCSNRRLFHKLEKSTMANTLQQ